MKNYWGKFSNAIPVGIPVRDIDTFRLTLSLGSDSGHGNAELLFLETPNETTEKYL